MDIEALVISLLQFLVALARGVGDGWRRHRYSAFKRVEPMLVRKAEVERRLRNILKETNGDAIIREPRRKDNYPELDETLRSISPWFKVELFDTYHAGIEVVTAVESVVISDSIGRRATDPDDPGARNVFVVGRIRYDDIAGIDWEGDEYYGFTHIYCRFRVRRGPYAWRVSAGSRSDAVWCDAGTIGARCGRWPANRESSGC